MPDAWELAYDLNPSNSSDAAGDLDGDGMTNLQEYLADTDPTDPYSKLLLVPVSFDAAGTLRLRFQAAPCRSYTVECTVALPPVWTAIYTVPAEMVAHTVELIVPSNGQTSGFYRVRTP